MGGISSRFYGLDSNWTEAIRIFDEERTQNPKLWPGSAQLLFRSECYRLAGERELAKASYYETIDDFPLGYYAHRARQKLAEFYAEDSLDIPQIETVDTDRRGVIAWLYEGDSNWVMKNAFSPQLQMFEGLLPWELGI